MIAVICILTPAVVATVFLEYLEKSKRNNRDFFVAYILFLIAITFVNELILTYGYQNGIFRLTISSFTNVFAVKYLALSLGQALLYPLLVYFIKKNVEVELEVKKIQGKKHGKKK